MKQTVKLLRLGAVLLMLIAVAGAVAAPVAAQDELPPAATEEAAGEPIVNTDPIESPSEESTANQPVESAEPTETEVAAGSTETEESETPVESSTGATGETPVEEIPASESTPAAEFTEEATPASEESAVEASSSLVVQAANGSFFIHAEDENSDPVEGACFEVFEDAGGGSLGDLVSDNICTDATGFGLNRNQEPGDYVATVKTTPDGFSTPANKLFTVVENVETDVAMVFVAPAGNDPGTVVVHTVENGFFGSTPNLGACYTVFDETGVTAVTGEVCDDDDSNNDGLTTIDPLDPGNYLLKQTTAPQSGGPAADGPFSLTSGQTKHLFVSDEVRGANGTFRLEAHDTNGDPVQGACFNVHVDEGNGNLGPNIFGENCSFANGIVGNRSTAPADYVVVTTLAPDGFGTPLDILFTVESGKTTLIDVIFEEAGPNDPGKLIVTRIIDDLNDDFVVPGACYRLFKNDNGSRGDPVTAEVCDDDDGNDDGVTRFTNIPPGTYVLAETSTPSGEEPGEDGLVTITPGQTKSVFMGDTVLGVNGTLVLTAEDANGDGLAGACLEVFELLPNGGIGTSIVGGGSLCSDSTGHILSRFQLPGDFIAFVVVTPDGFRTPADKEFTVFERQTTDVQFVFVEAGPNDPGSIFITKIDAFTQELLIKACFKLFEDAGDGERGEAISGTICDNKDGINDGRILIENVPPGTHVLAEVTAPAGFVKAGDRLVTVKPGQRTLITVSNLPRFDGDTGFTLTAEKSNGNPLEGACFEVHEDLGGGQLGELIVGGTGLCSDADGHVLSRNQEPGAYVAHAVVTPSGFLTPADKRFTVVDAEIAGVNVVFVLPDEVDDNDDGDDDVDDGDDDEDDDDQADVTSLPNTGVRAMTGSDSQELLILALFGLAVMSAAWGVRRRNM